MHTGTLKKWSLALTFWLALHMAALRAQTIPFQLTGGSGGTAVDFEWRLDGSIIEEGAGATSTLSNADLESGSRFIWYPTLSALRAGYSSTETVSQVGEYSVAFGYKTLASGYESVAMGYSTTASGSSSTASGADSAAIGEWSTALGNGVASGNYSTALGLLTTASGNYSTAMGFDSTASGNGSMTLGNRSGAGAVDSFVVGIYNVGGGSATIWFPTDPLFEVGNGGDGTSAEDGWQFWDGDPDVTGGSDAFVVYKNGNATVQGTLSAHTGARTAPGGDLSMGSFTAGTAP